MVHGDVVKARSLSPPSSGLPKKISPSSPPSSRRGQGARNIFSRRILAGSGTWQSGRHVSRVTQRSGGGSRKFGGGAGEEGSHSRHGSFFGLPWGFFFLSLFGRLDDF